MASASLSELAARARAARGYSGLSQLELAKAMDYSVETMSRIENGRRALNEGELHKIGQVCGVPLAFMDHGFELIDDAGHAPVAADVLTRMNALEDQVRELIARDARREVEEHAQTGPSRETASPPPRRRRRRAPGGQAPSDASGSSEDAA